jgi:DNA repair exonuclease SbcCD nuclease subunit
MKTIICGDTHIGAIFSMGRPNGIGGNTRVDDYEKSLNFVVDYAINNKADIFIQTGDLFEVRNPTTEHIQIADRCIKRLSDANIFTIVIMGNHDYRKTGENFTSALATMQANSYQNVRILLQPEVISYSNKRGDSQSMLLIPYRDKRMYGSGGSKELTDLFNLHIKELSKRIDPDNTSIAVGHNFFFDGNFNGEIQFNTRIQFSK